MYSKNKTLNSSIVDYLSELDALKSNKGLSKGLSKGLPKGVISSAFLGRKIEQLKGYFKLTDFLFSEGDLNGLNVLIGGQVEYVKSLKDLEFESDSDVKLLDDLIDSDLRHVANMYESSLITLYRTKADDLFKHLKSLEGAFDTPADRQKFIMSILRLKTTPELAFRGDTPSEESSLDVRLTDFDITEFYESLTGVLSSYDKLKSLNASTIQSLDDGLLTVQLEIVGLISNVTDIFHVGGYKTEYDILDSEGVVYTLKSKLPLDMLEQALKGNWYSAKTFEPVDITVEETKRLKLFL